MDVVDKPLFWVLGVVAAFISTVVMTAWKAIVKRLDSIDEKLERLTRLEERHRSTVERVTKLEGVVVEAQG